jgi:hypothetical protein
MTKRNRLGAWIKANCFLKSNFDSAVEVIFSVISVPISPPFKPNHNQALFLYHRKLNIFKFNLEHETAVVNERTTSKDKERRNIKG